MKNTQKIVLIAMTMFMLVLTSACGQATKQTNVKLTISAAASVRNSIEEIKATYAAINPDVELVLNFGGSGSLQKQIEEGAEVDIFISAAAKQMDALSEKGLILEDTREDLLGNSIVLVIPADSTSVASFENLADDNVKSIALGEPKSVPAGQYSEEALKSLGLLDRITPKAVYAKDVKEVLTWVETGNADAGIVYKTDAVASDKVKIVSEAPSGSYSPVVYPSAVMKETKNLSEAQEFINYMYSDDAKPVFEKYGFVFMP